MKIALTAGGTGGHFYPMIAVAEAIYDISEERRILPPEIILISDTQYDKDLLIKMGLKFRKVYAGKMRRYFSVLNITDIFKTIAGIIKALFMVYSEMPDVIFGKGGYVSLPVLVAARIFGIPVIIHESDSVPGKINKWAGKFAKKIAISFHDTAKYFDKEKTALTGNPIRKYISGFTPDEAKEVFKLEENLPVILVLGGSQGSQIINDAVLDIMPELVKIAQVIHQCGVKNEKELRERAKIVLEKSIFGDRHHIYPFLDNAQLRNATSVANLIISRAGAGALFEIAHWGLPSIVIPLANSAQNHQRENAYNYAKTGAALVIEEANLTPNVFLSEIKRILFDAKLMESMKKAAKGFAAPDAARKIAGAILDLAVKHSE